MPLQYTESQLADLIKGLETEFTKELNKAELLSKSEDGEKKDKKPSEDKKADAPPADAKPAEGEEAAPEMEAAPAEGEAAAPAAAPGAPAAAAPAAGHGYDDEDMEHMRQMYASMSKEELMAHHDAIRDALDAASAAPAPGAPAPEAQAQAPAAPAPGAPEMGKSEKPGHSELKDENKLNPKPTDKGSNTNAAYNENSGGKQAKTGEPKGSPGAKSPASTDQRNLDNMEKSEKDFDFIKSELDAEKAKTADLKKNLDTVQEFLTKLVTKVAAPKGKAITEVASLAKNEDAGQGADVNSMSKSEITQKLLQKSSDPRTSPQDRAAINSFYLNGANINTISHLLK